VGNERPGNGAGDARFEILCQPATATEPCESTFDDPSAGQDFEALRHVGTFDDFYRPFANALQSLAQFISGIATIGEDVAQPGIARADRSKDAWSAVAILNAGFMHDEPDQVALGVGDDVALAALDFSATSSLSLLPASKPRGPPLSVVFTDWLSITPAVGLASRPAASRAAITRV
jgi:hypothetical protein